MSKNVKAVIKLNLPAGEATAAPPTGPALGQYGAPIMDFVQQYNSRTKEQKGQIIPAVITIYEDRSFIFVTKLPPVAELIKQELKLKLGSGKPNKEKIGKLTQEQVQKIAQAKMKDLNTTNIEQAVKIVKGTAQSMGVETQ